MRFRQRNCPARRLGTLAAILAGSVLAACAGDSAPVSETGGSDITLRPDTVRVSGEVPRNATLEFLLRDSGLAAGTANSVIEAAREVFDPRNLKAAQPFTIVSSIEGVLRLFEYEIDADRFLRIMTVPGAAGELRAEVVPIPKVLEHAAMAGVIAEATPSLYQAMDSTGETPELTIAMAAIFAGEIDFNTEVRLDDRFAVAFERYTRVGGAQTYGTITSAEFQNDGRLVRAILFAPPGGEPGYYDDQGRSLKRFFLRSPPAVRAACHLGVLAAALPPRDRGGPAAPGCRLWGADGDDGPGRGRWPGRLGDLRFHQRPDGADSTHAGLPDLLPAPIRVRVWHPRRCPRHTGAEDRRSGLDGPRHRTASRLPGAQGRRLRESANRASQHAAGRSDSRRGHGRCSASSAIVRSPSSRRH